MTDVTADMATVYQYLLHPRARDTFKAGRALHAFDRLITYIGELERKQ